jgi:hypothetical protein
MHPTANEQQRYMDIGQCNAMALSTSGSTPYMNNQALIAQAIHQRRVSEACMQGKGYVLVPR